MGLNELFARLTFRADLNLPEVVWLFPGYGIQSSKCICHHVKCHIMLTGQYFQCSIWCQGAWPSWDKTNTDRYRQL